MSARRDTDNATDDSTPPAGSNQSPGPAARTVVPDYTPRQSTLRATLKLTRAKLATKEAECQRANRRITELEQALRPSQDGERGTHPATEPSSSTCKQRPGPPTAEPHKRTGNDRRPPRHATARRDHDTGISSLKPDPKNLVLVTPYAMAREEELANTKNLLHNKHEQYRQTRRALKATKRELTRLRAIIDESYATMASVVKKIFTTHQAMVEDTAAAYDDLGDQLALIKSKFATTIASLPAKSDKTAHEDATPVLEITALTTGEKTCYAHYRYGIESGICNGGGCPLQRQPRVDLPLSAPAFSANGMKKPHRIPLTKRLHTTAPPTPVASHPTNAGASNIPELPAVQTPGEVEDPDYDITDIADRVTTRAPPGTPRPIQDVITLA